MPPQTRGWSKPSLRLFLHREFGYFENRDRYEVANGQAWYSNDDTGVYFVFEWDDSADGQGGPSFNLNYYRPHIFGLEGEMLGVMFFGFCGLIVLIVPFLDRGTRTRLVLNVLAVISVIFAIVMTVWGYLV